MKQRKPKRNLIEEYMNETINVGGELMTRGQFIAEYQAAGVPRQLIDAYLMGYDLRQEIRQRTAMEQ